MYGHHIEIGGPFDQALERVQAALKAEGFGVLSDIDIRRAMKESLGKEMPAYRILGAWRTDVPIAATSSRSWGLAGRCLQVFNDLGVDARMAQDRQRVARGAAVRVVKDVGRCHSVSF